jgi:hypothetical protein
MRLSVSARIETSKEARSDIPGSPWSSALP